MPSSGVREDVERDEKAAVAPKHGTRQVSIVGRHRSRETRSDRTSGRAAVMLRGRTKLTRARDAGGKRARRRVRHEDAGDAVDDRLERAAASQRDDGRPQACASTGAMPKSSSPGSSTAAARRYSSRTSSSGSGPRNCTSAPVRVASRLRAPRSGPSPMMRSGSWRAGWPRWPGRCAYTGRALTQSAKSSRERPCHPVNKNPVSTGG